MKCESRVDEAHAANEVGKHSTVGTEAVYSLWTWAEIDSEYHHAATDVDGTRAPADVANRNFNFVVDVSLRADPLTSIMLSMVTLVSSLVVIYAVGYMHGDRGYWRFYSYVSLFVFSMTMLVSVSNFVLLYVFWEAVGVCSYLLVGFWYEKPSAAAAGKKAFLVTRVGDCGFVLGIFLIVDHLRNAQLPRYAGRGSLGDRGRHFGSDAAGRSELVRRGWAGTGDLFVSGDGSLRQERSVSVARVAARCDGRPHAR